jgi:hypothetical protein
MSATLLRNCRLFDPRSGTLSAGTSVLVSDQAIAAEGAEVIDLGGRAPPPTRGWTTLLHGPGMRAQLPQPQPQPWLWFRRCGWRSGVPAPACR